ncbi:MAG TPA: HPr-rel-A system PqqD family peptide chaperone [Gammaproteobacteria bacterium]|nr:HPr-rel-A system PqqD family peptide chaperone [Gammaproteobacteria bacterium]
MAQRAAASQWALSGGATLMFRSWEDETVVYHQQSGDTHALSAVGAECLRLLATAPRTLPDLVAAVAAACQIPPDAALTESVEKLVLELAGKGLLEER